MAASRTSPMAYTTGSVVVVTDPTFTAMANVVNVLLNYTSQTQIAQS